MEKKCTVGGEGLERVGRVTVNTTFFSFGLYKTKTIPVLCLYSRDHSAMRTVLKFLYNGPGQVMRKCLILSW